MRWCAPAQVCKVPPAEAEIDRLAARSQTDFTSILAAGPGQEDITRLIQRIAEGLAAEKKVELNPELLTARFHPLQAAYLAVANVFGAEPPTLFTQMFEFIDHERDEQWREHVHQVDYDVFPIAVAAYNRYAIEELHKLADERGLWAEKTDDSAQERRLLTLRPELDAAWSPRLFLWKKSKDDLLKEIDSVVRMPGCAT